MVEEIPITESVEKTEAEQATLPPEPTKVFTVESKMRRWHLFRHYP